MRRLAAAQNLTAIYINDDADDVAKLATTNAYSVNNLFLSLR